MSAYMRSAGKSEGPASVPPCQAVRLRGPGAEGARRVLRRRAAQGTAGLRRSWALEAALPRQPELTLNLPLDEPAKLFEEPPQHPSLRHDCAMGDRAASAPL